MLKKHCPQRVEKAFSPPRGAGIHRRPSRFPCALRPEIGGATGRKNLFFPLPLLSELVKVLIIFDFNGAGNPSWVSRAHLSFPLRKSLLAAHRPFPLLGFPAHTLYPQGVCSIRKAAKPLTAALPYRRGEFTALSTVSTAPKGPFFFARLRRNGSTSTPVCMIFCHMFIYQKTGTSRFLPGLDNSRKSIIISNYSKLYY